MKLLKNKKVIAALIALVLALVSVAFGVDFGTGTELTDAVCSVVTCE